MADRSTMTPVNSPSTKPRRQRLSGTAWANRHDVATFDRARKAAYDGWKASGLSMRQINMRMGMSSSWFNDYLGLKRTPKYLNEFIRPRLAQLLNIPEASLMPDLPDIPSPLQIPAEESRDPQPAIKYIPLIQDAGHHVQPLDWHAVTAWVARSAVDIGPDTAFAWTVRATGGSLRPGMVACATPAKIVRSGDPVVVVSSGKTVCDGILEHIDRDSIRIVNSADHIIQMNSDDITVYALGRIFDPKDNDAV